MMTASDTPPLALPTGDDLAAHDGCLQSIRERISQGLQSLREGKGTDGDAFFAQIYTELEEIERQLRE